MIKNKKNNMAQSFNINNTSFTGNLSQWAMTGMTWGSEPGSDEEIRKRKKETIKDLIGDDKYLLQEIVTELRREKLEQLKNVSR